MGQEAPRGVSALQASGGEQNKPGVEMLEAREPGQVNGAGMWRGDLGDPSRKISVHTASSVHPQQLRGQLDRRTETPAPGAGPSGVWPCPPLPLPFSLFPPHSGTPSHKATRTVLQFLEL